MSMRGSTDFPITLIARFDILIVELLLIMVVSASLNNSLPLASLAATSNKIVFHQTDKKELWLGSPVCQQLAWLGVAVGGGGDKV